MADIEKAIIRAGSTKGWRMTPHGPGLIEGDLRLRGHVAVIDIRYDKEAYSITLKSSENLNYDGSEIHPRYNDWIRRLELEIQKEIASI